MTELSPDAADQNRRFLSDRWRRRTLFALIFSRVVTVLAIGLFVAGAVMYFANFNFGSGGNARGAVMLLAAPCLGLVAVIGDLYGILAAWVTWRNSGSGWWLALAIVLPLLEMVGFAFVWCNI
jgi:hypothetical protein